MNKKTGVWLIVIGSLLFVANMVCSIIFRGENGANIFTAISGWVSGIATVILGIIAVVQNKSYKEENDRVLQKQSEENVKFIASQKDIAWRNTQYQLLTLYLSTLNKHSEIAKQYGFGKIHNDIISLPVCAQSFTTIIYEKNILVDELTAVKSFLLSSKYYIDNKEELYNSCLEYLSQAKKFFDDTFFRQYRWFVKTYKEVPTTEEQKKNNLMLKEQSNQIYELGKTFRNKLSEHIYNLNDLISDIYCKSSEDLKAVLEKSISDYSIWIEKVKKQEEQNNG